MRIQKNMYIWQIKAMFVPKTLNYTLIQTNRWRGGSKQTFHATGQRRCRDFLPRRRSKCIGITPGKLWNCSWYQRAWIWSDVMNIYKKLIIHSAIKWGTIWHERRSASLIDRRLLSRLEKRKKNMLCQIHNGAVFTRPWEWRQCIYLTPTSCERQPVWI